MPPKGRPRRGGARKAVQAAGKPEASGEGKEALIHQRLTQPHTQTQTQTQTETASDDVIVSSTTSSELERDKTTLHEPPSQEPSTSDIHQHQDDDVVLTKTLAPVNGLKNDIPAEDNEGSKVVVADSNNNNNNSNIVKKAKKVVKKTVKVVKKVIKKKVIKKKVPKKPAHQTHQLPNIDSISNSNSTIPAAEDISLQLKLQNHDSDKNQVMGGTELMEVDNIPKNEEDVVEEKHGECTKESLDLEEKEQGEEVGEGKLFRGELEAMERRKRRKTEIFIGRLDQDANQDDITKVFAEAGTIVDFRLLMNSKTGKKFAFLRYSSSQEAKRALQMFAKVKICGKECGASPVEGNDTIFLGNMDKQWKDVDVVKLLNKIGIDKIDKVTVMIDPNNRECNRGFAFVEFETIKDAQVAYTKLQEKDIFGKNQRLKVAWAEPLKELDEEEMLKVKTVYAEFIPSSWDEEKVRDSFKKFGEIDDVVLARNLKTSKRKDFAFIRYKTREAAIGCIESFGHELKDEDGTKVNVNVSLAKPMAKEKRKLAAKAVAKEVPVAKSKTSHSQGRPSELRYRTQPSVPQYGIPVPEMSSTNVELVRLLREQASQRPPHTSLRNSPMDIHYSSPLSGRKRQFSLLDSDPMYGDLNRYPFSCLDASYSVASSSHNVMPPGGLTSPMAYNQGHREYPSRSLYGATHYANNVEIRDKAHESSYLYRRSIFKSFAHNPFSQIERRRTEEDGNFKLAVMRQATIRNGSQPVIMIS